MKKIIMASLLAFLMVGVAQANLSGSVGATTDYIWRGVSQSDEGAALQGNLTYDVGGGVYVDVFGSSVDFVDADVEVDATIGYRGNASGFSYDVGFIQYYYPDTASDYDFNEVFFGGAVAIDESVNAGAKVSYSDDYAGLGSTVYTEGFVDFVAVQGVTVTGKVGFLNYRDGVLDNVTDYSVSASRAFDAVTVNVGYAETDDDLIDGRWFAGTSLAF